MAFSHIKFAAVATSMNADLDTIPEQTADEPLNTKKGFSTRNRVGIISFIIVMLFWTFKKVQFQDRSRLQTPLIGKDSDRRAITTIEENSLIGSKLLDTIPKSNALELPNYELISSKSVRIEHKKRAITTDFSSPPLYLKRKFGTELNTNDECA